ncbi:MAG TPA: hypothetical protein DCY79_20460 [Planctomycetaceae bacterium]|nr:hypothetical protein [Blastopirellula sp.]HAY82185.1 hypothetical protein [Planctomycetaceae bacterium]
MLLLHPESWPDDQNLSGPQFCGHAPVAFPKTTNVLLLHRPGSVDVRPLGQLQRTPTASIALNLRLVLVGPIALISTVVTVITKKTMRWTPISSN